MRCLTKVPLKCKFCEVCLRVRLTICMKYRGTPWNRVQPWGSERVSYHNIQNPVSRGHVQGGNWKNKFAKKHGFEGLEYVNTLYKDVMESKEKSKTIKSFIKKNNQIVNNLDLKNVLIMIDDEGDLSTLNEKIYLVLCLILIYRNLMLFRLRFLIHHQKLFKWKKY